MNSIEIQKWIDDRKTDRLPAGRHVIDRPLTLYKSMGYALRGAGGLDFSDEAWDSARCGTTLEWRGPPNEAVFTVSRSCGFDIDGITIRVPEGQKAAQCILVKHGGGSLNFDWHISLIGGTVGIQWGTTPTEQTCANCLYRSCIFQRQTEACVRLMNTQSLEHAFQRPKFTTSPIGVDVQAGGDVSIFGGGSYELGTLLKLGNVSQNTRGFDVTSFRFDGDGTRTAWLDAYDTDRAHTFGVVSFRNCGQNKGQQTTIPPLFTVPPGCRCVADCCDFNGSQDNWARVYSDARAGGEFIANDCSGLDGTKLGTLVTTKGPRAWYEFVRCGNLYSKTGSVSTFPEGEAG